MILTEDARRYWDSSKNGILLFGIAKRGRSSL
jgi:hypothetical protein